MKLVKKRDRILKAISVFKKWQWPNKASCLSDFVFFLGDRSQLDYREKPFLFFELGKNKDSSISYSPSVFSFSHFFAAFIIYSFLKNTLVYFFTM